MPCSRARGQMVQSLTGRASGSSKPQPSKMHLSCLCNDPSSQAMESVVEKSDHMASLLRAVHCFPFVIGIEF